MTDEHTTMRYPRWARRQEPNAMGIDGPPTQPESKHPTDYVLLVMLAAVLVYVYLTQG